MRNTRLLLGLPIAAVLAAVLVVVLRPSASAVTVGGPLGPQDSPGTACLPGQAGQANTDGLESYRNGGTLPVVIDRVSLAGAHGLRIAGADIVPGRYSVGTWKDFPPPCQLPPGVQWAKRRPPQGARVLPGQWVNIVVGLEPTGSVSGRTAGLVVWYHVGGTRYERVSRIRVVIALPPAHC